MKVRWLGWAGVEVEARGETLVIDPLADPGATFAALGKAAADVQLPAFVTPRAEQAAVAGLVTHLHRDHTDAAALAQALAPEAAVHMPAWPGGEDVENLALAQANAELDQASLARLEIEPWDRLEVGPFTITAMPAVDGLGDPQVSWGIEVGDVRVAHFGDTRFHGWWWRMARRAGPFDLAFMPINGAAVNFPHLQPPSPLAAAMDPEEAALAGELLGAEVVVPIHYDGYAIDPWYRPVDDAVGRFLTAAEGRSYEPRVLGPGEELTIGTSERSSRLPARSNSMSTASLRS
jgi:L-ascorbate metabolism protein UlaG (beta-lactamase superfamily)